MGASFLFRFLVERVGITGRFTVDLPELTLRRAVSPLFGVATHESLQEIENLCYCSGFLGYLLLVIGMRNKNRRGQQMEPSRCSLPNLVIAGVHKAGTTSLYTYLAKHPEICQSYKKEIGHFMPLILGGETQSISEYESYFAHCTDQMYRIEASPSYFYGKGQVASAMKGTLYDIRVILVLRDPTDRLISFFRKAISKSSLPADTTLSDFVAKSTDSIDNTDQSVYARAVREGMYINYIRPWHETFGRNLKIVFFDDLQNDAFNLTVSICKWLGLNADCFRAGDFTVENKTLQYRFRGIHRCVQESYMRNEVFWRKHHKVKQALRRLYNLFNTSSKERPNASDMETISHLHECYEPYNMELRLFLESIGYDTFPSWLPEVSTAT